MFSREDASNSVHSWLTKQSSKSSSAVDSSWEREVVSSVSHRDVRGTILKQVGCDTSAEDSKQSDSATINLIKSRSSWWQTIVNITSSWFTLSNHTIGSILFLNSLYQFVICINWV